jgi:hypothetical protein
METTKGVTTVAATPRAVQELITERWNHWRARERLEESLAAESALQTQIMALRTLYRLAKRRQALYFGAAWVFGLGLAVVLLARPG